MPDLRFIVPFGHGGASDRAARSFARALGTAAASAFSGRGEPESASPPTPGRLDPIIENVPGAGGLFGVQRANELARAGEPVLLLSTPTTHVLLRERLGDSVAPDEAFRPLAGLGSAPNVLLVSPRLGVRSVDELIARATCEPLVYASAGTGQTIHVATALFCRQAGIRMTHQPYDGGSATAYADLIAGRVHVYFDNLLGCRDRIAQGHAVPLAVSDTRRSHLLPDVPTLAQSGIPGHALDVWLGVFGAHGCAAFADIGGPAFPVTEFAGDLRLLGLSGGPISAQALALQVETSSSGWREALAAGDAA